MTSPHQPAAGNDRPEARPSRAERRRERLRAEVSRSRDGDHTVPTWAMAVLVFVLIGGWLLFVYLVG